MTLAWLFSGQGSQKPGMGSGVLEDPAAAEVFECASDHFGFDVYEAMQDEDAERLNRTDRAQAAIVTLSVSLAKALESRGVEPSCVLGFSLGQISALAASRMLGLDQTFALAARRANLMDEASRETQGAMSALLGTDPDSVARLCEECSKGEVLVPANYNCPGQIVISGALGAIERAEARWAEGKGRFARLATSGAFHSPLMEEACRGLASYLDGVDFAPAEIPLIDNVTARPLDVSQAKELLAKHLVSPVRFEESVRFAIEGFDADRFAEIGFGGVLVGLVRRIDRQVGRSRIESLADLAPSES